MWRAPAPSVASWGAAELRWTKEHLAQVLTIRTGEGTLGRTVGSAGMGGIDVACGFQCVSVETRSGVCVCCVYGRV